MKEIRGFWPEEVKGFWDLLERMETLGFQATYLSRAARIWKRMLEDNAVIFFGFTSNMVSSGLRELIAFVLKERWVHAVVTTVGSIEEDVMKSLGPFFLGEFDVDDAELRKKGINRIGNIFVPNERYVELEKFLQPVFEEMKQIGKPSPKQIVEIIGRHIKDEKSWIYWAYRNKIPVFCPAPTDGAFGLQFFFYKQENPEVGIDVTADMKDLADLVLPAEKTGAIILGGGVPKHHILGINLPRGGLDYAIYITTANEWDGSLSGARLKEGISWGKVSSEAKQVTIHCEATIAFPLLVMALYESIYT